MLKPPTRTAAVVITRTAPSFLIVGWASILGINAFADIGAATHLWSDLANLREYALAVGAGLGLWVMIASAGIAVEGQQLTLRGWWTVWHGSPWAVRGAVNQGDLTLTVRRQSSDGPSDVRVNVAAVQSSVIEARRGNVRADGAIRRLRNVQAATPLDGSAPIVLRRRWRYEVVLWVAAAACAQWVLTGFLWSRG